MELAVSKLAVVGAGLVGRRHVDNIAQSASASLAAIVDPAPDTRRLAQQHQVPWFSDIQSMLCTVKPDGVIISTPNHLHVRDGLACVEARCPVLIEKPISTSAEDATRLVTAADSKRVPVLVGHHRRYNPLIRRAKQLIDEGQLGDIRAVQATCWLYKPDDYFDGSPWRMAKGAGPVAVNLVHDVDLMRFLVGEISNVHAIASPSARGHENEDVSVAVLRFEGGAVGTISVSDTVVAPWSWELTARENPAYSATNQSCYHLGGSHGSLSLPDLKLWRNEGDRSWWAPLASTNFPVEFCDPLREQIEHFCRVIQHGEAPVVSGLEGVKTLRVIEAIQQSASTGATVDL